MFVLGLFSMKMKRRIFKSERNAHDPDFQWQAVDSVSYKLYYIFIETLWIIIRKKSCILEKCINNSLQSSGKTLLQRLS